MPANNIKQNIHKICDFSRAQLISEMVETPTNYILTRNVVHHNYFINHIAAKSTFVNLSLIAARANVEVVWIEAWAETPKKGKRLIKLIAKSVKMA